MKAASNFIDYPLFGRQQNCTDFECWKVKGEAWRGRKGRILKERGRRVANVKWR